MQNCLSAKPELRPTFDELRAQLATFLEKSAVQYGYLSLARTTYLTLFRLKISVVMIGKLTFITMHIAAMPLTYTKQRA